MDKHQLARLPGAHAIYREVGSLQSITRPRAQGVGVQAERPHSRDRLALRSQHLTDQGVSRVHDYVTSKEFGVLRRIDFRQSVVGVRSDEMRISMVVRL